MEGLKTMNGTPCENIKDMLLQKVDQLKQFIETHIQCGEVTTTTAEPLLLDLYPGASAAYSLRKLSVDYNGYCCKVTTNGIDSSEIGFVNGIVDTASILSFAGASTAYILTWYDQSGNNNDAYLSYDIIRSPKIATGGAVYEINGKPAIYFDTDYLGLTSEISSAGDFSAFTVYKRTATNVTAVFFGNLTNYMPMSAYEFSDNNVYVENRQGYAYSSNVVAIQSLYSAFSISNTLSLYKNSASKVLTNVGYAGNANFNCLGVRNTAYPTAYFQEGIIYTDDESSNRSDIETNINNFYSIY